MAQQIKKKRQARLTRLGILALALSAQACGTDIYVGPDWEGVGVLGEYIIHDGSKRNYALHIPSSYDSSDATPVLIMLHGGGDTGPNFQRWTELDAVADEAGIMVVWPTGTGYPCFDDLPVEQCDQTPPHRWLPEDADFLDDLIDHLRHELYVDTTRIFASGFSNGSIFSHQLACEGPGRFAAFAIIAGSQTPQTAFNCAPTRSFPLLYMHGTEDGSFPFDGSGPYISAASTVSGYAALNGCVGEPTLEWLPDTENDGTRVWTERYDDCTDNVEVLFYGIEDGGHTWPGVEGFPLSFGLTSFDIVANEVIVDFLSRVGR